MGQLRVLAVGRRPNRNDGMNGMESDWAQLLELDASVEAWRFEPVSLRIAKKTFYRPDFLVIKTDGRIEIHEVKGHWEDDARVKIKTAAELYPWFKFLAIRRPSKRKGWQIEEIHSPSTAR